MTTHETVVQKGPGNNLFVFGHIDAGAIRAEVAAVTGDDVVAELWGLGTSAYQPVLAAYGGWKRYVERLAAMYETPGFDHTTLTCWSAGGALGVEAVYQGYEIGTADALPDALVMLDSVYGSKPPGSKQGDGKVVWTPRLNALARYALNAAQGGRILVLMHSAIATPYASSGECVRAIVAWVEKELGTTIPHDDSLTAADLEGRGFTEARALGNLHVISFPKNTASEHIAEVHLFDRAWHLWIPWMRAAGSSAPSAVAPSPADLLPATERAPLPAIRRGSSGPFVRTWQAKLVDLGWAIDVDGDFGPHTDTATKELQARAGLIANGVVDAPTRAAADGMVPTPITTLNPGPPPFPMLTDAARDRIFGAISARPAPTTSDPEAITILGSWVADNLVQVYLPQLSGIVGAPASCKVSFHRLAAQQLRDLWAAWEEAGLLPVVRSWSGSWSPRYVRGRPGVLSRHAHAIAFDLNAPWNPLGRAAVAAAPGSVVSLVALARAHGFFWGGDFVSRPDPMHFEIGGT